MEHDASDETMLQPTFGSITSTRLGPPLLQWSDATGAHTFTPERSAIIGSAPAAAIVVADRAVSRIHAEVTCRDDGLWVRDLGSRNGTFVEGVQVHSARVPEGGRLRVGTTVLSITHGAKRDLDLWPTSEFGHLVGGSVVMRELFAMLARVAKLDASILIEGETGTGKELVARAVHDYSPRASKPFVVVDCGALPDTLLDAELFGHAKGAFTGAVGSRAGAFESADGGTLFLDEIGELPIAMQPKLLRVLESRTVRRLGEIQHRPIDVRIVSATHRDLLSMVGRNDFREDLYFRLAVIPCKVPPLRERMDDLERLVQRFVEPPGSAVSADFLVELRSRPWRGNVRELRNFVQRAVALGADHPSMRDPSRVEPPVDLKAGAVGPEHAVSYGLPFRSFREQWIDQGERSYVYSLLQRHDRNVAAAAQAAGVDRTYLYRLIRKHSL